MMTIYWISALLILHTWIGYLVFLLLMSGLDRKKADKKEDKKLPCPFLTVILTVRNEEKIIGSRLQNILESDYPGDLLEIIVASDGSADKTEEIAEDFARLDSRIKLLAMEGGGKSAAQNRAITAAKGEIIVLTDAHTVFERNTLSILSSEFSDERTGCVSGRLVVRNAGNTISESQGFYWRYETLLRRLEGGLGLLHTASGPVMAFRTSLFKPFDCCYGDDCIIPLDIISQGYRVVHSDLAQAYDVFPSTMREELSVRTRMTLRNITCTLSKYNLLNPFKYKFISLSIFSHKILRWLTPYLLITLFAANLFILEINIFYKVSLYCQSAFYMLGLAGFYAEQKGRRIPLASQVFSFLLANIGFFLGILKAGMGRKITGYR